jgi:hypothetical protein
MDVMTAAHAAEGDHTEMKHFTINADNHITTHASRKAARETGAGVFATEVEFADLIGPDSKRLVEIWNRLPGVKPVTKFTNRKIATERIWQAIADLGGPRLAEVQPIREATPLEPSGEPGPTAVQPSQSLASARTPDAAPQVPGVAPATGKAGKKPTPVKKAPQTASQAATAKPASKTAVILALLQRAKGATLAQIMEATSWQAHSVRGFISGTLGKKLGLTVNSVKNEGGERTYSIKGAV